MLIHSQSSRRGVITAVICLALAAVVAAMASLNVALPDIAHGTHASQTDLTWVIDAYSLAFVSLLLPGGGLGDRFGRRTALIVGLLIFGGGVGHRDDGHLRRRADRARGNARPGSSARDAGDTVDDHKQFPGSSRPEP